MHHKIPENMVSNPLCRLSRVYVRPFQEKAPAWKLCVQAVEPTAGRLC